VTSPKPERLPRSPVFSADQEFADWLYTWGNLPTNPEELRMWLHFRGIAVEAFKHSGRYMANVDRFEWLKEL
jgi:hypothetical protein